MRILIIGPYAPHGQVGAIRMISLSRYLVAHGHKVTVLCLSEETLKRIEPKELTAEIPKGVIVKYYDITVKADSLIKKNALNSKEFADALNVILDVNTYDAVLVSGGPFYTFPAMKYITQRHIPYMVDYRDLHISSPDKRKRNGLINTVKFWLTYPFRYYQEYSCVKRAARISVVAPEMAENLQAYFHLPEKKFTTIYNGYDDVQLEGLEYKPNEKNTFRIGYFGKLMYYNQEYTKMLFRAIEQLDRSGAKIEFLHIGPENPAIQSFLEQEKMNGNQWYVCTGLMNYRKGIELLSSCNAYALEYAYPEGPGTKIFDYICLNKPVIGITRPGIMLEKLIKSFDHGYICHTENEIVNALLDIESNNISVLIDGNQADIRIKAYSRSHQNREFEATLLTIGEDSKDE